MKKIILICTIALSQLSFGANNLKMLCIKNLTTDNAVNYNCRTLTIQGSSENDTLYINKYDTLSYQKNPNDTLLGYNFISRSGLMHPHFKVYVRYTKSYDGVNYCSNIQSIKHLSSEKYIPTGTKIKSFKKEREGELPYLINLLREPELKLFNDTLIAGRKCEKWSVKYLGKTNDLYIDKKTAFPIMLRIITNPLQPFIMEYHYDKFNFTKELNKKLFSEVDTTKTKKVDVLKVGKTVPVLSLQDLSGNTVSFTNSEKFKIVYLSMINCSPCQQALPHVKEMYKKYYKRDDISFQVFYPFDSKEKLLKYVSAKNIEYPIIYNSIKNENERVDLNSMFGLSMPSILILNKENKIVALISGFNADMQERVEKQLKIAMTEN